ncbi:Rv0909 family putative TA system antitoxin [Salana multivorans]
MGVDDIINKAKDALGGEEGIEEKIEQAREFIKDKTPDNINGLVDKAADAARNAVDTDGK